MGSATFSPYCTATFISSSCRRLVQQQNAERAVVDDALGQLRDAREQLIQIEHGRDFAADLGQQLERLRIQPLLLEQPRVHERRGHVRRELPQDVGVAIGVPIADAAQDVQRANGLVLVHQRHGDGGRHARHHFDVAGIGADVAEHQRLLRGDDAADEALRQLQPDAAVSG